jgi:amino acid transporter
MVATTGIICGYLTGTLWPGFMSATNPGPMFMMAIAILFSFFIAWIANRGVSGSTSVNIAINVIQIAALVVFSIMALSYRAQHPEGAAGWQFDSQSGEAYNYEFLTEKTTTAGVTADTIARDANGVPKPKLDAAGKPVPFRVTYPGPDEKGNFQTHQTASSVVAPHNISWAFIQATVAILILVGFESVTAMGGEAKNAKRDVPIAVIVSLLVQGCFCYLFEYFAANYFLSSGYPMTTASGSAAPIGDMMIVVGNSMFGPGGGRIFMLVEAFTVILALIGTTLSCMNTGARVTYAMGKDSEVPEHFGLLHSKSLTPHRAIWSLAVIAAIFGCLALIMPFGDAGALSDATVKALPQGFWSSFGYVSHDTMAAFPQTLLTITLASNFGTFVLYALSCIICVVAYHGHPNFKLVRHLLIPLFGLGANLACMAFYLIGPFMGYGTKMEPLLALGIAAVWALYGGIYFIRSSKSQGRSTLIESKAQAAQGY